MMRAIIAFADDGAVVECDAATHIGIPWLANEPLVGPPANVAVGVVLGIPLVVLVPNQV